MVMSAILKDLTEVDESLREHYKPVKDGEGFVLDVTPVDGLELSDTKKLRQALEVERGHANSAQGKLKTFDGINPTEAKEAIAKVKDMGDWDPDKKIQEGIAAREKQMVKKHEEEKKGLEDQNKGLMQQLTDNIIKATATAAIAAAKGSVGLLLPHVMKQTRMRKNDGGTLIAEVVDGDGNQRVGDSSGTPMTIPQLVDEMKQNDDFARAFEATGASGSGASGDKGAGAGPKPTGTVSRRDQGAVNRSIEDIASGKVTLTN